jgi:hypothetical protein
VLTSSGETLVIIGIPHNIASNDFVRRLESMDHDKKIAMQIERNDKIREYFVEESKKLIAEDETKIFDAIMDAGAAAKIQGIKFSYRKYIKEDQMERFTERLLFRILLLKKQNER